MKNLLGDSMAVNQQKWRKVKNTDDESAGDAFCSDCNEPFEACDCPVIGQDDFYEYKMLLTTAGLKLFARKKGDKDEETSID